MPRLGSKAFLQSAGFLRVRGGPQPLDNSAVHPESYYLVEKMARAIIEGKMKWEDDPEIKDILFKCTMCGGCDAMDKGIRDAEMVKMYRWMRYEYIKKFGQLPEHAKPRRSLANSSREAATPCWRPPTAS